jgi:hypothetical protein
MTDTQTQSRPRRLRKNPNGQRSVYQRADGLWIGAAYVLTATGHRRRITVSSRSDKEATRKLRDKITQSDKGIPIAGESWTVQQYFHRWLDPMVKVTRPKTYQGYEGIVEVGLPWTRITVHQPNQPPTGGARRPISAARRPRLARASPAGGRSGPSEPASAMTADGSRRIGQSVGQRRSMIIRSRNLITYSIRGVMV